MDIYTIANLVEKGHYDFIAKCETQWHLIGLRAYLYSKFKSKQSVKGLVAIVSYKGKNLINENSIQFTKKLPSL